jgi:hypothetical protein
MQHKCEMALDLGLVGSQDIKQIAYIVDPVTKITSIIIVSAIGAPVDAPVATLISGVGTMVNEHATPVAGNSGMEGCIEG